MPEIISTSFNKLDIQDQFFDSLKSMYREFDDWFSKKAEYEEPCDVVYGDDGKLKAMLYTKVEGLDEDYSRMEHDICRQAGTFRTGEDVRGSRIFA